MLGRRRFVAVKHTLLDMLHEEKVITIDEVMHRANREMYANEQMSRKQTKLVIAEVIESAKKGKE